ncbi:hypothetical protein Tco_1442385 [Tanacetum coccineum]
MLLLAVLHPNHMLLLLWQKVLNLKGTTTLEDQLLTSLAPTVEKQGILVGSSNNVVAPTSSDKPMIEAPLSFTNEQMLRLMNLINEKPSPSFHANMTVVPEYTVNLLFVHKLAKDSKLFVGFDEHKCYIQDLKKKEIMGIGNEQGGIYLFNIDDDNSRKISSGSSISVCSISKSLWHK